MNLHHVRAPSIRFFFANGWESTTLKERNQAVRDLVSFLQSPLQNKSVILSGVWRVSGAPSGRFVPVGVAGRGPQRAICTRWGGWASNAVEGPAVALLIYGMNL
jgi:hypothetical protein